MPVHVKKKGSLYCVVDINNKSGKGRCHATKAQAVKQAQAINLSLIRQGKIKVTKKQMSKIPKPIKRK